MVMLLLAVPALAQDRAGTTSPTDFSLPGERTVQRVEQVIFGRIVLQGKISADQMLDVRIVAISAMSKVCSNQSTPVVASIVQNIMTYGLDRPEFIIDYKLLPPIGGGHYCIETLSMLGYGNSQPPFDAVIGPPPIRALLQMEFRNYQPTFAMRIDNWVVTLANQTCAFAAVISPVTRAVAEHTTTAPPGGTSAPPAPCQDGDPRLPPWIPPDHREATIPVTSCNYANNACTCASMSSCRWALNAGRLLQCQQGYPRDTVSCSDCPLQNRCPISAAAMCGMVTSPCACASSTADCRWDLAVQACVQRGDGGTPCAACSSQSFCSKPSAVGFEPTATTSTYPVMGVPRVGWIINMTFDRSIFVNPRVQMDVELDCRSIWEEDYTILRIPKTQIQVSDNMLQIDVYGIANDRLRDCDVVVPASFLLDRDYVPFAGLTRGNFMVDVPDTVKPTLVSFSPPNSKVGIRLNSTLTIFFNEPVVARPSAFATLTALGGEWTGGASGADVVIANIKLDGNQVQFDALAFSMTINFERLLETTKLYSLSVKPGMIADKAGNTYDGLLLGIYAFRTAADPYAGVAPNSRGFPWAQYWMYFAGAAAILACLLASLVLACCMCRARQRKIRDQGVGPPRSLQNWVPEPLKGDAKLAVGDPVLMQSDSRMCSTRTPGSMRSGRSSPVNRDMGSPVRVHPSTSWPAWDDYTDKPADDNEQPTSVTSPSSRTNVNLLRAQPRSAWESPGEMLSPTSLASPASPTSPTSSANQPSGASPTSRTSLTNSAARQQGGGSPTRAARNRQALW